MSVNGSENQAASREYDELRRANGEEGEPGQIRITDKRRVTLDGDSGIESAELAEARATVATEMAQLMVRLRESEEKRLEAERQLRDYADRFNQVQKQMQTENEGLRARLQRAFDQRLDTARGEIVEALLDSLDNLKRAVAAAEKSPSKETEFRALLEGIRVTAGMFESKMRELGLTLVPCEGEEFNPEIHEAVEIVAVPPEQDNKVVAEFQPGYRFGDKLVRPARVRVGRAV
jgi:molecular chaperone GrpE